MKNQAQDRYGEPTLDDYFRIVLRFAPDYNFSLDDRTLIALQAVVDGHDSHFTTLGVTYTAAVVRLIAAKALRRPRRSYSHAGKIRLFLAA